MAITSLPSNTTSVAAHGGEQGIADLTSEVDVTHPGRYLGTRADDVATSTANKVGASAVCTAWADGYLQNQRVVKTQVPVVPVTSPQAQTFVSHDLCFGTPGLVARDIAGLHWERELANANNDITWDLYADCLGVAEANAI